MIFPLETIMLVWKKPSFFHIPLSGHGDPAAQYTGEIIVVIFIFFEKSSSLVGLLREDFLSFLKGEN